ncbi:MAG: DNA-binding response regulator [Thiomonas sp. 20-64-9]|jgi:DNA-binding response OmpR family regulator|nr:MAG: DNA-binding response regulator [Thiomonas sp. 20-64-9]OZB70074.1 MAG: DNA-binding response regulator [Thiomonas sp. 13-64-67]
MTFFSSTVPPTLALRIAYLEDDPLIAHEVSDWLREAGYDVQHYTDGQEFARAVERGGADACLLDWMLPGLSGPDVLCRLRLQLGANVPPVIFLTGRNAETDVVQALESGADDYLVKPLSRPVLLARLQAVLRRSGSTLPAARLRLGEIEADCSRRQIFVQGERVELTDRETDLALHFLQNVNRLLTRDFLIQTIWGLRPEVETRTVDVHVSALRRKLRLQPESGWRLVSVYGRGYRLERARSADEGPLTVPPELDD